MIFMNILYFSVSMDRWNRICKYEESN